MAPPYLLVIPSPAPHTTLESLQAAYEQTFSNLFKTLVGDGETDSLIRLDIALVLPRSFENARSPIFVRIQHVLKLFYSLSCIVALQLNIDLDINHGLDIRVFMLKPELQGRAQSQVRLLTGPIVDMETFAEASREYSRIYSVEGESASLMLDSFLEIRREKHHTSPEVTRLICGSLLSKSPASDGQNGSDTHHVGHKRVAVGGTFDHLHIGHKLLLTATLLLPTPDFSDSPSSPRVITIGITTDALLVNKKFASMVEPWDVRQKKVAEFVEDILVYHSDAGSVREVEHIDNPGPNGKIVRISYGSEMIINYTAISDGYGPTITDESITALVISLETRSGGKAVNDKRKELGWSELEVFEVDVLDSTGISKQNEGFETKISSTQIRKKLSEGNMT